MCITEYENRVRHMCVSGCAHKRSLEDGWKSKKSRRCFLGWLWAKKKMGSINNVELSLWSPTHKLVLTVDKNLICTDLSFS